MNAASYPVVIDKLPEDEGGGYVAYAVDLYGCIADGDTRTEAAANVEFAIAEWIDETIALGREVPAPGSFAKQFEKERKEIVALVKQFTKVAAEYDEKAKAVEELDSELDQLKQEMESILSFYSDCNFDHDWVKRAHLPLVRRLAKRDHAI